MENASKALIIAGSVLIAILVISLLVVFYNNIKEFQNANHQVDILEQISEFNKQYDVYYRDNLFGSDILSIANKVVDYNIRESNTEGYSRIETSVKFKTGISPNGEKLIDSKKKYNAQELNKISQNLEKKVTDIGKEKYAGKTISALSGMRDNQLEELIGKDKLQEVKAKNRSYLQYKSALTELKSKNFKATEFKYDKGTARISLMQFEEIWYYKLKIGNTMSEGGERWRTHQRL